MTYFSEMTPEQFEDWMVNVRPILVRQQEQARERARQSAVEMIGRPYRSREEMLDGSTKENTDGW
jgi:hypothetical protein